MEQNKALSVLDVAKILHVSKNTVYEMIRRGDSICISFNIFNCTILQAISSLCKSIFLEMSNAI